MKFTIKCAPLLSALSHLHSVVERRNSIPILDNVLIDAVDGRITLSTTDMDLELCEQQIVTEISTTGRTTLPAQTFYNIVRKMREGAQIECETIADTATLRSGRSTFVLPTISAKDFPVMAGDKLAHSFTLTAADLRMLIDYTKCAISIEQSRYYLNGIYLHATKNNEVPVMRAVATDGHRLARVEMVMPEGAAGMPGIIVPRKTVIKLRKLVDDFEGDVAIKLSATKIRFSVGDAILTSKLIDGTFPDYEKVIPRDANKIISVDGKELISAVDRVTAITNDKTRAVKLTADGASLTISANSPENGTSVDEIECRYDGPPIAVSFNSRYLLDIVIACSAEIVQLRLSDSSSPAILTGDNVALFVLMPTRA